MARELPHVKVQRMLDDHSSSLVQENQELRDKLKSASTNDMDRMMCDLTADRDLLSGKVDELQVALAERDKLIEDLNQKVTEQTEQLKVGDIRINELNQVNMSLIAQIEKTDPAPTGPAKSETKSKKK